MPYSFAISFSNVQQYNGLPTIFMCIAFDSEDASQIRCVKTKDDLFPDPSAYPAFDLSLLENELNQYNKHIKSRRVTDLRIEITDESTSGMSEKVLKANLKVIDALVSGEIGTFSIGVRDIFAHIPLNVAGEHINCQKSLPQSIAGFKYPIIFQEKGSFNDLMQIARLEVLREYLKRRRERSAFASGYIRDHSKNLYQIVSINWKSRDIRQYSDSFVGCPDLIVRTPKEIAKIPLTINSYLNFLPIAHTCLGVAEGLKVETCLWSGPTRPFGVLTKEEKCATCSRMSEYSTCLPLGPKCDGSSIKCGNYSFAGNVCNGDFSIYLTIFDDTLKVGKAVFSRTIARLLEQSAFDALVFYPVNSLNVSHRLEKEITGFLRRRITRLKPYGIRKVAMSVKSKKRFEHIMHILNGRDTTEVERRTHAYETARQLLITSELPMKYPLSSLKSRRTDLEQNWSIDGVSRSAEFIEKPRFTRIVGNVDGFVGSFVFLGTKVYDFEDLLGSVVECQQSE